MGCGSCSRGRSKQAKAVVRLPNTTAVQTTPVARSLKQGVTAQTLVRPNMRSIQKRCPKCRWPMNCTRRFSQGVTVLNWTCLNRKCKFREESQA